MHRASHNRYLNQMLESMRRSMALLSSTTMNISLDEADYRFLKALDEYSEWLREEMALPLATIISTAKSEKSTADDHGVGIARV